MLELRTHVTFMYPGSFFSEPGRTVQIPNDYTFKDILDVAPDDNWFSADVVSKNYRQWVSGDAETWLVDGQPVLKKRYLIGTTYTTEQVEALGGDNHILLSNMRGNDWPIVCRTRAGNWTPVEGNDEVISPLTVAV